MGMAMRKGAQNWASLIIGMVHKLAWCISCEAHKSVQANKKVIQP